MTLTSTEWIGTEVYSTLVVGGFTIEVWRQGGGWLWDVTARTEAPMADQREAVEMDILGALRNLRHLYEQMIDGNVKDCAMAARGLLGPAIERIETSHRAAIALDEEVRRLPPPVARIVRMERGRTWHSVLIDRNVTIVTDCGVEMTRGAWWQTEDERIEANCKKCERARARRAGKAGQP